jgi:hypothetical protein
MKEMGKKGNKKGEIFPFHDMKPSRASESTLALILNLGGDQGSNSRPGRFIYTKELRH